MLSKGDEKKLSQYMKKPYRIEILKCDSGFFAKIRDLPGCITEADTLQELYDNIMDAKQAWLLTAIKQGIPIPLPTKETPMRFIESETFKPRLSQRDSKMVQKYLVPAEVEGLAA